MSSSPAQSVRDDAQVAGDRRALTKGERQRRAILEGLTELLRTRSITDLTVGEIAAASGVQRSGFYFYFESKYAALAVLTSEIWAGWLMAEDEFTRADDESPGEFLNRSTGSAIHRWHAHDAVLVASVQAIPLDPQIADLWRMWNDRLSRMLIAQVQRDAAQGHARPVSDDVPRLVSTLLEMTMYMFYKDRLDKNDEAGSQELLDTLRAIWLSSCWGEV